MSAPLDDPWEARFEALFPAYLLPSAMQGAIDPAAAEQLVRRVLGPGASFATFRASTLVAAHGNEIAEFALRALPDLCRALRGRTEVTPEAHRGRLLGRLDVPRTLAARMRGDRETLVSRVRVRRYDQPAEVVVRAVVVRLCAVLASLLRGWGRAPPGWATHAIAWDRALRSTLERTALRRVAVVAFDDVAPHALRGRPQRAFALAATLFDALRETLDSNDPRSVARCVAKGALWPMEPWQRFELAVALTLAHAIEHRLTREAPGRWQIRHAVVDPRRQEIVVFECDDGRRLRMFYNQSPLASGRRQEAIAHYFGGEASSRPDVVVLGDGPGREPRAVVIEVKLSRDPSYLHRGFDEAIGYAVDYARHLSDFAGSVLVTPGRLRGAPRPDDKVVAIGWPDWLRPHVVHDAVLATIGGAAGNATDPYPARSESFSP